MEREVTAGLWDSLKNIWGNILGWLKDLTTKVDSAADEMEQIAAEAETEGDLEEMF